MRGFAYTWFVAFLLLLLDKPDSYSRIETYGGKGTLKLGCNPDEHAVVYMQPEVPTLLQNETPLTKEPIEIVPSSPSIRPFARASRIRFGKSQPIQYNARVKDIGDVRDDHIPRLVAYYRMEHMEADCENDGLGFAEHKHTLSRELSGEINDRRDVNDDHK